MIEIIVFLVIYTACVAAFWIAVLRATRILQARSRAAAEARNQSGRTDRWDFLYRDFPYFQQKTRAR